MKRTQHMLLPAVILAVAGAVHAATTNPVTTLDQRLTQTATSVNTLALSRTDQEIATMLSPALGVDASALLLQHQELGGTWGDLLVAHELSQVSRTSVSTERILALRSQGTSWSQVLADLRISRARLSGELGSDLTTLGITPATNGSTDGTSGGGTVTGGTTDDGTTNVGTVDDGTTDGGTVNGGTDDGITIERSRTGRGINDKLAKEVDRLESEAGRRGDGAMADRLASALGVSSSLLEEQRAAFDVDWGELLIAYTVVQQSRSSITIGQVFDLRDAGMTWFQIAKTLKIPPGRLMNMVRRGTSDLIETTIATSKPTKPTKLEKATRGTAGSTRKTSHDIAAVKKGNAQTRAVGGMKVSGATAAGGTRNTVKMTKAAGAMTMRPTTRMTVAGGAAGAQAMRIHGAAGGGHGRR